MLSYARKNPGLSPYPHLQEGNFTSGEEKLQESLFLSISCRHRGPVIILVARKEKRKEEEEEI